MPPYLRYCIASSNPSYYFPIIKATGDPNDVQSNAKVRKNMRLFDNYIGVSSWAVEYNYILTELLFYPS